MCRIEFNFYSVIKCLWRGRGCSGKRQRRVKGEQRLQEDPLTGPSAAGSSFSGTGLVFEPPSTYFL